MKSNRFAVLAMFALLAAGCSGSGSGNGSSPVKDIGEPEEQAAGDEDGIKRRDRASLPPVDAYLPPLDGGRLRLAPPQGWNLIAREKYLARMVKGEDESALPRLAVSAADSPSPEITDASEDNVDELVKELTAASKEGKRKPVEPVRPIILGDHVFARHVRLARYKDEPCAIVSLQTVQDGRLYTVDLYVEAGSDGTDYPKFLKQSQDFAYALAANMLFGDEPEPTTAAPMETKQPAEDKPAEEQPAEESPAESP